jgi:carbamate kinase
VTRVVAALGGNALLRRSEPPEAGLQRANVRRAVAALAGLARTAELVVTHGNGPQVGLLALQAAAYDAVPAYPLDVLGAESEGMIGYLLEQALGNELPGRRVATLLTQVVVAADDPAFGRPTKPIGPVYAEGDARRLAAERGWTVARDGRAWRRVVPSPDPRAIVELETIRLLVDHGVLVVCTGGGGIPVVEEQGLLRGVEAVVDKDLAAALLARELGADLLLLLTDVAAVERRFGRPDARPIARVTPAGLRRERFAEGSMGPKVEAACRFVEATGGRAGIGALADAARIAIGEAGTLVVPGELGPVTDRHEAAPGAVSPRA